MSSLSILACRVGMLALLARTAFADCHSFAMDFHDGGSYFQNSLSSDPFTFVSEYEGCQNDNATNILVDPIGDQYLCSNTPLQPDDTDELSTCPLNKNQLFSGEWSVLILSNNGDAEPIAFERDFELSVGPQETSTFTPTITNTVVSTPIVNITVTTTDTTTTTLPPSTVTTPSITVSPTTTVTPARVTSTTTRTLFTVKETRYTISVVKATKTVTATCTPATRQSFPDPKATITPTIATAAALSTPVKLFRRLDRSTGAFDMAKYLKERKARLAARKLEGRAPDPQPLIVTDTVTSDWITTTTTSTAPTSTGTLTTGTLVTATVTPVPITVASGQTVLPIVTVTAATPTKTSTTYTFGYSITTKTLTTTYTIKSTTTPAAVKTTCRRHGGTLG